MTEQLNVQQMAEKLLAADNILILCHKNPDGDTVGCGSALYYALLALEKHAAVLCADPIPGRYAFTNPRLFKGEFEPQIVVAVDVASVQLFGEGNGVPQYTRHVDLCIDHHAGNSGYAEFTLLDGSAAAAAELLYEVICAMHVEITPHIADCLYTGLSTDTGCFVYSNTTARTHRIAAALMDCGIDVAPVNKALFRTKSRTRLAMEAWMAEWAEYYDHDRVVVMQIPLSLCLDYKATEADVEELSSLAALVEGTDCGVTLRELKDGRVKISLRTGPRVNATDVCALLGGGGHAAAAGATLHGTLGEVKQAVLQAIDMVAGED